MVLGILNNNFVVSVSFVNTDHFHEQFWTKNIIKIIV